MEKYKIGIVFPMIMDHLKTFNFTKIEILSYVLKIGKRKKNGKIK